MIHKTAQKFQKILSAKKEPSLKAVAERFRVILKAAQPATELAVEKFAPEETEEIYAAIPEELLSSFGQDFNNLLQYFFENKLYEFPDTLSAFFDEYARKAKLHTGAAHKYTPSDIIKNIMALQPWTWGSKFRTTDGKRYGAVLSVTFEEI